MGNLKAWMAIGASAAALVGAPPARAGYYMEPVDFDAGGLLSSQSIGPIGTQFNGIMGNVGGASDPADAFGFFFGGGDLYAAITQLTGMSITITPAQPPDAAQPGAPMPPGAPRSPPSTMSTPSRA